MALLEEPEILRRIDAIRKKLQGADPDHLAQVDEWERRAKKEIITMSMMGHEGIKILIARAREEIADINKMLLDDRDIKGAMTHESLIGDSLARQRLLDMRAIWTWFLGFFAESAEILRMIEGDIAVQEQPDEHVDNGA